MPLTDCSNVAPAPKRCMSSIGPAIGPCCYELGKDLVTQMQQRADLPALQWASEQPHNSAAIRPQARAHHQGRVV